MHLDDDELKNPCLDYVKNIIFAPPNATFKSGDHVFQNYDDLHEAFTLGKLSEEDLKDGLVNELNKLLAPVRQHFTENEHAKNLLAQVRQFKRDAASPAKKEVRRLDLVKHGKVPKDSHVVFLPQPVTQPTLQSVMDVLAQMKAKPADASGIVLFISDWSSLVQNHLLGESKPTNQYYEVFLAALKIMAADQVEWTVVKQSESILCDPSMYWISVINVGRYFSLDTVMGDSMKDSDGVGKVIVSAFTVLFNIFYIQRKCVLTSNSSFFSK